jgi:LPS sulfotransferase NodH
MQVAFIIGSPRSGTTILENILNCHPAIVEWYEPYYMWGQYFSDSENDIWEPMQLTPDVINKIRNEFEIFSSRTKKPLVLDKSHRHVFNLKIIQSIFPDAKWIHIVRDGRDVTLSIHKEWIKRKEIVTKKDFWQLFLVVKKMLKRQPLWKYKMMAILYEMKSNFSIIPSDYLNKSKWKGKIGWGLRFENWQEYLQTYTELEFNAMQWVKSVEAVKKGWDILPEKNKIEISYENLLTTTHDTLGNVLEILELDTPASFYSKIPKLNKDNFNKWSIEFSEDELNSIRKILAPLLNELNYAKPLSW